MSEAVDATGPHPLSRLAGGWNRETAARNGWEPARQGAKTPLRTLAPPPILACIVRSIIEVRDDGRRVCHHA
jgi:hypothetical protein